MNELEQQQLNELLEPQENKVEQYKWDEEFQRQILGLLILDKTFLIQSLGLIDPNCFSSRVHQDIFKIVFNYFNKYKNLPNKISLNEEINTVIANRDDKYKVIYFGELNTVVDYFVPGIESREYLLDKITNFAKIQRLKASFRESLSVLKDDPESENTWNKIYESLQKAMTLDRNFDEGLNYFETVEERYERRIQQMELGEIFSSGFPSIDEALIGGGLCRGEIGSYVGLSGAGKSLALVTAAIANLNRGKRVLYISLEIDSDKVAERFDAQLIAYKNAPININKLIDSRDAVNDALKDYVSEYEDKKLLVIKQFAAGEMDMNMFRAYFSQITLNGFRPDLVIVDYVGEMRDYAGMPTHESRQKIVRDLRGFAKLEDVLVLTAMQPNIKAKEAQKFSVIDDDCLADAYGQIRPLDALWSINQTQDEKDARVGRLFVSKHRSGYGKFIVYIQYDPDTLGMSEITMETYADRLNAVRHEKKERRSKMVAAGLLQENIDDLKDMHKGKKGKKKFNDVGYNEDE